MGTKIRLLATGAVTLLTCPAFATDIDSNADLRSQITRLNERIAQLETQTNDDAWLTAERAADIRSIVQDVIADADMRSSLLQGGISAGHDGHFFISSADGNFHLELAGQVQVRWVFNNQDDGSSGTIDSTRHGFEIRRNKINFSGHVFDPTWQFDVTGAFERDGGLFVLEDAKITKDLGNGWEVNFGQFKPHFMREENISSKRQLAVDRSLVNEEYNQDRAQGVEIAYSGDKFHVSAMYSDGIGSDNVAALAPDLEWGAITARADILFAGSWKQMKDFTSFRGEDFAARAGAGVHYEVAEYGTPAIPSPEEQRFTWTVDGQLEFGGANLFAAVVGNHLNEADADQFGAVIQGGFFLTDKDELFARFEWADPDGSNNVGTSFGDFDDLLALTIGWNHYFNKHSLKWTTDVGFGLNEISSPFASSGAGWRADAPGEDSQVVVRSQFQLLW